MNASSINTNASVNKWILFLFCSLLNLRILTELPRVLRETNWLNTSASNYDLNRSISFLIILFCSFFILAKRKVIVTLLFFKFASFLFLFLLASCAISIHTFTSLSMPVTGVFVVLSRFILELVLVLFVTNFIRTPDQFQSIFRFFFKPTIFIFLGISSIQILTSSYVEVQGVYRITGPFGNPNTLASFLHLFIVLTFYYYGSNRSKLFWFLIIAEYGLLFFTGSIGNILASLLFILLVAIRQHWLRLKRFFLVFPVLLSALIAGIIYKWDSIVNRFSILINPQSFELTDGSSIKWRIEAWGHYIDLLGSSVFNWIFGLGIGVQRWMLHPDYSNSQAYIFEAPGSHNDYLGVLVDFGLVGLLLFIFSLAVFSRIIKKAERIDDKLYLLRFYFYTILFVMISENYIDQLIAFIFIIFITSTVTVAFNKSENLQMGSNSALNA